MTKNGKLLLGALTFWPLVHFVIFFLFVIAIFAASSGGDMGAVMGSMFVVMMVLHMLTIFLILGLQIYYIVSVLKRQSLSDRERIAWVIGLFFGGFVAMPLYWYMKIWSDDSDQDGGKLGLNDAYNFEPAEADRSKEPYVAVPREPLDWR